MWEDKDWWVWRAIGCVMGEGGEMRGVKGAGEDAGEVDRHNGGWVMGERGVERTEEGTGKGAGEGTWKGAGEVGRHNGRWMMGEGWVERAEGSAGEGGAGGGSTEWGVGDGGRRGG